MIADSVSFNRSTAAERGSFISRNMRSLTARRMPACWCPTSKALTPGPAGNARSRLNQLELLDGGCTREQEGGGRGVSQGRLSAPLMPCGRGSQNDKESVNGG